MTTFNAPLALWLDPDLPLADADRHALRDAGWSVHAVQTLDEIPPLAAGAAVLIVRLRDDSERLAAVQLVLQDAGIQLPVAARVDRSRLELVVEALRLGAIHVQAAHDAAAADWARLRELLTPAASEPRALPRRNVVFVDPASQHLLALARRVAQAEVTALLVGPTGSGKEVLARVLHEASPRAAGPFVALNAAALPENLIEDLLFGHEKGAFTGAFREHKGVFEQAQGGTLFLDEIGEMPLHLQSKLLRVLQERQLTRLGGHTAIALDVRVVAATNKDLRQAIASREFREDLYYRIATFRMRLLPLCERRGDILPLARQCLAQFGDGRAWSIHPEAQAMLLAYPWPGNVRELENVMRRTMVLCADGVITPAHLMFDDWLHSLPTAAESVAPGPLPVPLANAVSQPASPAVPADPAFAAAAASLLAATADAFLPPTATSPLAATPLPGGDAQRPAPGEAARCPAAPADLHSATRLNEHQIIMATLAATPSRTEAARRLGISPRTLRYKLAQLREMGLCPSPAN